MQSFDHAAMQNRQRPFAIVMILLSIGLHAPQVAVAGPVDEAKALAVKGAAEFAKAEYFSAASKFEHAYALNPREFRVLRYAGRAWQEIGFYERALTLLERYHSLETDVQLTASIEENLNKLRKATAQDKAEALERATTKFPEAKLEVEASKAFETLGDVASMKKAAQLLEVARMATTVAGDKDQLGKDIQRLRNQVAELEKKTAAKEPVAKEAVKPEAPVGQIATKPVEPGSSGRISGLQMVAWGGGAALIVGGVALMGIGAGATKTANDDLSSGAIKYDAYLANRSSADTKYYAGIGLCAVGALGAVAGFFLGPFEKKVVVAPSGNGFVVAGEF